ncbi:hypothetical protein [Roseivirga pacifica]
MKIKSIEDFESLKLKANDEDFDESELVVTGAFRGVNSQKLDIVFEGFREDITYVFMDFECGSVKFNQNVKGVEFRGDVIIADNTVLIQDAKLQILNIALGEGSSKKLNFQLNRMNIGEFNISGSHEIHSVILESCLVAKFIIDGSKIQSLSILGKNGKSVVGNAILDLKAVFSFSTWGGCSFTNLKIQDFNHGALKLNDSVVDCLLLNRVSLRQGHFKAPKVVKTFEAESFDIGEMASSQLHPLVAAQTVILHSISGIKEIKGDVIWPRKLYGQPQENQEVYRGIKERATEEFKYDLASFYKRMELLSHFQHQKSIERKWYNKLELNLTMGLPYFASRFGTKLLRPIFLLLCFHLLLSIIMVGVSGQQYGLEFTGYFTWSFFFESLELYFYTILPTHRISYNGAFLNTVVSFFMRLSSGIFIYHIILTSRRHLE